jgi:hypothetical protein
MSSAAEIPKSVPHAEVIGGVRVSRTPRRPSAREDGEEQLAPSTSVTHLHKAVAEQTLQALAAGELAAPAAHQGPSRSTIEHNPKASPSTFAPPPQVKPPKVRHAHENNTSLNQPQRRGSEY